ncbi:hypothetical protein DFH07DRAFT_949414 [Mycena maculata]|uniref:Uncharacterized protein n=1 Tax=Mycena maculata TaxID=230809 RepID=A0AAD7KEU6_9AGAR|nr:hypothetical protein DFH07DRAFT_949414 [Mycena maculata]
MDSLQLQEEEHREADPIRGEEDDPEFRVAYVNMSRLSPTLNIAYDIGCGTNVANIDTVPSNAGFSLKEAAADDAENPDLESCCESE